MRKFLFYIEQNYAYAMLRPLQKAIVARGDQVTWFLAGEQVNSSYLYEWENKINTVDDIFIYNPDAIFYPANIAPTFLPGINVAAFHGFDAGKLDKRGRNDHFKVRNCFDLYCTQGPNTTQPFLALAEKYQHFTVKETGWAALDPLYENNKQLHNSAKPTILLCSTFSRNLTCAPILFEKIKQLSATGKWQWLVQFHPKMPLEIVEKYKSLQSEHLSFIETDDVIPLLQQADVMVCDTSSVISMFLLLNKPVVTFKNSAPKDYMIDINDVEKLESSIELALTQPKALMMKINDFCQQTHPYTDGKSASRVLAAVDEMLAGNNLPKKKKPFNFIRNFKMRKKLHYWKFF